MESQISTHHDAELILKLYDLRREQVMRRARHWIIFEFNPKTAEEMAVVVQAHGSEHNAYFRQVISYWEMAASFVLHGALKADLFLDTNGEGLYIFAKFHPLRADLQARTGMPFMYQTAKLVEKYPLANERFQRMLQSIQSRAS
jgi:hypothetical protein